MPRKCSWIGGAWCKENLWRDPKFFSVKLNKLTSPTFQSCNLRHNWGRNWFSVIFFDKKAGRLYKSFNRPSVETWPHDPLSLHSLGWILAYFQVMIVSFCYFRLQHISHSSEPMLIWIPRGESRGYLPIDILMPFVKLCRYWKLEDCHCFFFLSNTAHNNSIASSIVHPFLYFKLGPIQSFAVLVHTVLSKWKRWKSFSCAFVGWISQRKICLFCGKWTFSGYVKIPWIVFDHWIFVIDNRIYESWRNVFLTGTGLLVHPVTDAHSTGVNVYFPGKDEVGWFVRCHANISTQNYNVYNDVFFNPNPLTDLVWYWQLQELLRW